MTEIFIVNQSSGSYNDHFSWPVAAFPTKEEAEEWVAKANEGWYPKQEALTKEMREYEAAVEEKYPYPDLDPEEWDTFDWNHWEEDRKVFQQEWEASGKCSYVDTDLHSYSLHRTSIPYYGPTNL